MQPDEIKRAMLDADRDAKRRQSRNAVLMLLGAIAVAVILALVLLPLIPR